MARRVVFPGGRTAVLLLLLAAAVVLSNVPSSALATSSLPASADGEASSSTGDEQRAPPSSSSEEADEDDDSPSLSPEQKQQKEKERQAAKEKAVAEEKAAQQELLQYAKEKHIVSPTNGTGWYKGIAREFVDAHNKLRARYGVPPMKWDKKLARQARRWSNAMRKDCGFLHSGGHDYGQSIFRSHDNWNATATEAVDEWAKEEAIYDKESERCRDGNNFKQCGHFALMVAKRSTKVGCARAECFKSGVFITCNYDVSDIKKKKKKTPSSSSSSGSN